MICPLRQQLDPVIVPHYDQVLLLVVISVGTQSTLTEEFFDARRNIIVRNAKQTCASCRASKSITRDSRQKEARLQQPQIKLVGSKGSNRDRCNRARRIIFLCPKNLFDQFEKNKILKKFLLHGRISRGNLKAQTTELEVVQKIVVQQESSSNFNW